MEKWLVNNEHLQKDFQKILQKDFTKRLDENAFHGPSQKKYLEVP